MVVMQNPSSITAVCLGSWNTKLNELSALITKGGASQAKETYNFYNDSDPIDFTNTLTVSGSTVKLTLLHPPPQFGRMPNLFAVRETLKRGEIFLFFYNRDSHYTLQALQNYTRQLEDAGITDYSNRLVVICTNADATEAAQYQKLSSIKEGKKMAKALNAEFFEFNQDINCKKNIANAEELRLFLVAQRQSPAVKEALLKCPPVVASSKDAKKETLVKKPAKSKTGSFSMLQKLKSLFGTKPTLLPAVSVSS